jgi:hypothetical protein
MIDGAILIQIKTGRGSGALSGCGMAPRAACGPLFRAAGDSFGIEHLQDMWGSV